MGRPSKVPQQGNITPSKSAEKTLVYEHAVKYNGKFYPAGSPIPIQ